MQDCCDKRLSRAHNLGLKTLTCTHSPMERSRCDLKLLRLVSIDQNFDSDIHWIYCCPVDQCHSIALLSSG